MSKALLCIMLVVFSFIISCNSPSPYRQDTLVSAIRWDAWEGYKATGRKVVPWVTTGHNTKPRIDNPVSWTTVSSDGWVSDGTPGQIADNLSNALRWTMMNKSAAEANTVLMYAWNEFDEGGMDMSHTWG